MNRRERACFLSGIAMVIVLAVSNLMFGSVSIPPGEVWHILAGGEAARESWRYIVWESRLPQCLTALLCGASLSVSGLLLQTAFQNPLADPSILGISSGAGLGVAVVMLAAGGTAGMGSLSFAGLLPVVGGAFAGAMSVMALVLFLSTLIKDGVLLLIAGILIGYVVSSAISLLNFFATAEGVHSYLIWGLGNFGGVSMAQMPLFSLLVMSGLLLSFLLTKSLNAWLLGTRYAENLGVNIRLTRSLLLLATGLLTAVSTAFCGPISFLGLAVPHVARLALGTSNHHALLPVTLTTGAATALLCNLLCLLPGDRGLLPLNAVTPLVGAPVILYVIIAQRKLRYFQ